VVELLADALQEGKKSIVQKQGDGQRVSAEVEYTLK
jgi:hypothetical protein